MSMRLSENEVFSRVNPIPAAKPPTAGYIRRPPDNTDIVARNLGPPSIP